jgi:lysophospholipase L1-like esterase
MQWVALCAVAFAAACSDATQPTGPTVLSPGAASATRTKGGENYVAIGTSVSMGWASNGVYAGSQIFAWPELMRFGGGGPISLPLIQFPGCQSPLASPLGSGVRLSGEPVSVHAVCAPNEPGVQLPTQDVGLSTALALDVLGTTPETGLPWYARVLPPHTTPLQAALVQQPTLVSIELGANEVLNATTGLVAPFVTVIPVSVFEQAFDAVLGFVGQVGPKGLIVAVPTEARNFPLLRRGDEIWADAAEFAALHVDVSSDCNGSPNYINVPEKSLILVFTAAFTSTHGLPNPVFSCADVPGTEDLVLTPADIATVNGMLEQIADHQQQQAAAAGYAFTTLAVLYGRPDLKPPVYSVLSQLTSAHPYGPYISLDGLHPSPLGQSVLARAAAKALNDTYPGIAAHAITIPPAFGEQLVEPTTPAMALDLAKRIVSEHAGTQPPSCAVPATCFGTFTRRFR